MSSVSVSKQSRSKKNTVEFMFSERIRGAIDTLLNNGVPTSVIDDTRRLMLDLFSKATEYEKSVNELNASLKKYRKESKESRTPNAYRLYCRSITDSVRNDFIATCPRVTEEETTDGVVTKVEKLEYLDSKGMKNRCAVTGVPITVITGILSAKWKALSVEEKSVFVAEAARLKSEHEASKGDTPVEVEVVTPVVVSPVVTEPVVVSPAPVTTTVKKPRGRKPVTQHDVLPSQ